jgi:uncharacterized protein YdaU (DUF1376 family)
MPQAKEKAPAYQWYPKDWKSDTRVQRMTYEQRGIYRELMDTQWLEGSISADPAELARILGIPLPRFRKVWPLINECFTKRDDGRLVQLRLERARRERKAFRLKKQKAGRVGGIASVQRRRLLKEALKMGSDTRVG